MDDLFPHDREVLPIIALALATSKPGAVAVPNPGWAQFIAKPSTGQAARLATFVEICEAKPEHKHSEWDCLEGSGLSYDLFYSLLDKVIDGNGPALSLAMSIRPHCDYIAAWAEDLDKALGELIDRNPRAFLQAARMHNYPIRRTQQAVATNPMYTIDHFAAQKRVRRRRAALLTAIRDPSLKPWRDAALAAAKQKPRT